MPNEFYIVICTMFYCHFSSIYQEYPLFERVKHHIKEGEKVH